MLSQFMNFDVDRLEINDLVALVAFGEMYRAQFEKMQLDEPDFINNKLRVLKREINIKRENTLLMRKKQLEARIEGYKTPTQKKAEDLAELKQVEKQLAGVV
jgi:hypothetical protein